MKFTLDAKCHGKMYLISEKEPTNKSSTANKYWNVMYYNYGCRKCPSKIWICKRMKIMKRLDKPLR